MMMMFLALYAACWPVLLQGAACNGRHASCTSSTSDHLLLQHAGSLDGGEAVATSSDELDQCCWGGCNADSCQTGNWCASSEVRCTGPCKGTWCPGGHGPPPNQSPSPAPTADPSPAPTPATSPSHGTGCCKWGSNDCGYCGDDGTGWCHGSTDNCAVCGGVFDSLASTPTCGNPAPTSPTPSGDGWDSRVLKATHYWDCNGQGCDATVLEPWDESKYVASPGYGPQSPDDHGGAMYGEKMWLTGAASDTLAALLGTDDPCCGRDDQNRGGCGKCLLIQNPDAVNAGWTAVVMKKNRCPPWAFGCGAQQPHFDIAAPGFDVLQFSTANVCGIRAGTGFENQSQSEALGTWYNKGCADTSQCMHLCDQLPAAFVSGCKLFASWGWTRGDPPNVKFQAVACPAAFIAHIGSQFGPNGIQ